MVDSDVFNICERVKEISPNLHIVVADPPRPDGKNFIIMEETAPGDWMSVARYEALDNRVITHLEKMKRIPLHDRLAKLEKEEEDWEKKSAEDSLDELYERMGGPMWTQLEHDGFVDSRGVSYPKKGVTHSGKS
jgi:hypothetical protein